MGEPVDIIQIPEPVDVADGNGIVLTIGSRTAYVNGTTIILDSPPFIGEDGRTMVPVRFIADTMGADIGWDAATLTVTITPPDAVSVQFVL